MRMFWLPGKQKAWEGIKSRADAACGRLTDLWLKLDRADLVECEGCGCLLMKKEKYKLPSTVELRDVTIIVPGGSGHPYAQVKTGIQKEEYMQEHYRCGRCKEVVDVPVSP